MPSGCFCRAYRLCCCSSVSPNLSRSIWTSLLSAAVSNLIFNGTCPKKKYHTWLRVHVLLSTVDEAQLRIGADKMPPKAGQIFVANVAAPHQVMNKGDERVALLIDVRMQNRKLLKESALGRELLRAQRKLLAQRHMVQAYTRMRIALQEWYHKVPAAERFQIEIHRHKFDQKLWAGPTPPLNSELFSAGDHCGLLGDSEHDLQSYLDHGWTLF